MKVYAIDQFKFPLPSDHRFPLHQYTLLRCAVESEGLAGLQGAIIPDSALDSQILLAHDKDYLRRFNHGLLTVKEIRRIGLIWSTPLVERAKRSVGATIQAARSSLVEGVGVSLSGGTHHAFIDHGEGFCVFNDCVIASRVLQNEDLIQRAVILDCDVHQGNGTASMTSSDASIFTFSIHARKNFPFRKFPSDVDIALEDGVEDNEYLEVLFEGIRHSLALANPDIVFYLAGADPHKGDRLGRLSLSKSGLLERDRIVLNLCYESGLPVVVVMAGGYGKDIRDTVQIHLNTVRAAREFSL